MNRFKKTFVLLIGALLAWGAPLAAEDNLLSNGSFEEYSCNVIGCSWDDWTTPLGQSTAETTDKLEGDASFRWEAKSAYTIDNPITLGDDLYAEGTTFEIKMFFKVLVIAEGTTLKTDCYWEPKAGGDAEAMKAHDAAVLQQSIAETVSSEWDSVIIRTTKPANSSYLRIRVRAEKNTKVLLDAFSVQKVEVAEPYIHVTPSTLNSVSVNIGESKDFQTIHVEHGNVEAATTFRVGGEDAAHFQLSATSLPADQSEIDLIVTYAPTSAGTHRASLIFDNEKHTTILPNMIILNGSCVDSTKTPEIHVTPSELPLFEAVVGNEVKQTIEVSSENATDYIYLRVEHVTGAAFTIDASMLARNSTREVEIRFTPREAGDYESTLTIYSEGAQNVVLTLNGKGKAATPETVDWMTDFSWEMTSPVKMLNESFDEVEHNKTLKLEGWQNVAAADERPWWGFDEAKTSPVRGDNKCAKATAYQFGKDSTGTWDLWLVTPALDYKNAESQVFSFSVMGEYLPEDGNLSTIELYYIDATNTQSVFFQVFDGLAFPRTSDEEGVWIPFEIHLENQAHVPDVFFMAFRYTCPNGTWGAETYYIDDVKWGLATQGMETVTKQGSTKKILREGQLFIIRGEKIFNALGQELR